MKSYPLMVNIAGRQAVVIGGGPVGLRKVQALREAGAAVRLVAPQLACEEGLEAVEVIRQPYRAEHLRGAMLVFACTDDRELNSRIARDARSGGAWVNAADQPEDCDFFVPAVISDGPVQVAIGTGGASPALSAALKNTLAAALPSGVGAFASALSQVREELQARSEDTRLRCRVLRGLVEEGGMEAFARGGLEALRQLARTLADQAGRD